MASHCRVFGSWLLFFAVFGGPVWVEMTRPFLIGVNSELGGSLGRRVEAGGKSWASRKNSTRDLLGTSLQSHIFERFLTPFFGVKKGLRPEPSARGAQKGALSRAFGSGVLKLGSLPSLRLGGLADQPLPLKFGLTAQI